jgi:RNA polymerase subunit RPABC4/transcription elongation factor Spt4
VNNDDFICPVCGAEVPGRAKACPECGADERTGWSDQTIYDGTGIADPDDEEFNHDDWMRREGLKPARRTAVQWTWWIACVLVLAALLLAWVF